VFRGRCHLGVDVITVGKEEGELGVWKEFYEKFCVPHARQQDNYVTLKEPALPGTMRGAIAGMLQGILSTASGEVSSSGTSSSLLC
jgi:hypothetical protein